MEISHVSPSSQRFRSLPLHEEQTDGGLKVIALQVPGAPLIHAALVVPSARLSTKNAALAALGAMVLLWDTDSLPLGRDGSCLQDMGGELAAAVDTNAMTVRASAPATETKLLLRSMAQAITRNDYPSPAMRSARRELTRNNTIAVTSPGRMAVRELWRSCFTQHPGVVDEVLIDQLSDISDDEVRYSHPDLLSPHGSTLLLVGGADASRMAHQAVEELATWRSSEKRHREMSGRTGPSADPYISGDLRLVPLAGANHCSLRLALPALGPKEKGQSAQQIAATVLGGYFSSRLVANLREEKGYCYSVWTMVETAHDTHTLLIGTDTPPSSASASLEEIKREIERMSSSPPSTQEIDRARAYMVGSLRIAMDSQSGALNALLDTVRRGLNPSWLISRPDALMTVDSEEVAEVASQVLRSSSLLGAAAGDVSMFENLPRLDVQR